MKKSRFVNKTEEIRFQKLQELKVYKKARRSNRFVQSTPLDEQFYFNYGRRFQSSLTKLLFRIEFINKKYVSENVVAPNTCTLENNYDETVLFIKKVASSIIFNHKDVVIDFSKCNTAHLSPLFFIQILIFENQEFISLYNEKSYSKVSRQYKVQHSKSLKINRILYALNLIQNIPNATSNDELHYLSLGIKIGAKSRKHFYENKKGSVCNAITKFVDDSLMGVSYKLKQTGRFYLDSIIAEILGNAEDHSDINRWYVNGVSLRMCDENMIVVELNLCIINFGYSIYEGLENNKDQNLSVYKKLNDAYEKYKERTNFFAQPLPKESMFTIFALQEGISRLKFQNESRGNGTMNFLRAFFQLGSLGDAHPKFKPTLSFFSGKTSLNCTNKYKPINKDGLWVLALNDERDLIGHQDKDCIKYSHEYIPGTILQVSIFLNEDFFRKLTETNEQ